ncbi:BMC_2a_G0017420.mRNA.1.CDS.1 [Saccharomyces cerevisiae]|nr:hypothetical protein H823_YJM1447F00074 [Saccharomyces cerevisiae YJM1447]CAI4440773.1 BMC_2a_G0017420.mRNA.1.CDS.1 [Saccharomyces cerevisiae]CAI4447136.1 BMB_G0017390.mRNA.1.CDS.1 [Saccharomyces cerevisiae]CAI7109499.1 BMC_2a_G0017420.mRNA.1.CDS.1 [Saccharomyces cerevisiae]CAI7110675.1 BMB_G0017390.mRNA.1.CDS.1 [Saccharomyces cerevisiae]
MWCYSHFLLIFVSFVTSFAHKLPANNSTTNGGIDGIAVPVIETTIDSGMYSENGTDLMTPEDLPDLLSDGIVLSFANTTETGSDSDSTLIDSEDLQRCIDMPDRSCSAQRGNLCSYSFSDIPFSFLNTVHDIFGMTNMGNCAVMAGDKGAFYYKYYPVEPNCNSTIHQKTIDDALQQATEKLNGDFNNIYFFHVNRGGLWHGDMMVGTRVFTWFAGAKWAEHKGSIEAGFTS